MTGLTGHMDAHAYLPEAGCTTWARNGDLGPAGRLHQALDPDRAEAARQTRSG